MVIVTGLVGTGKTVEALKQCARHQWVFVTEYSQSISVLQEMAKKLKLRVDITTYAGLVSRYLFGGECRIHHYRAELAKARRGEPGSGFYIDNIEGFLKFLFGDNVKGFTCEGEDLVVTCKDEKIGFYRKDIHLL